uniref:Uncharacterized protein n=1 Tax=Acrobeloides nanus TaxID=290746 RepID=A0A914CHY2_9BILA
MEILSLIWPLDLCGKETVEVIYGLIQQDIQFLIERSLIIFKENPLYNEEKFYTIHPIVHTFLVNKVKGVSHLDRVAKTVLNRLQYDVSQRCKRSPDLVQATYSSRHINEYTIQNHFPYEQQNMKMTLELFYESVKEHLQLMIEKGSQHEEEIIYQEQKKTNWLFGWFT